MLRGPNQEEERNIKPIDFNHIRRVLIRGTNWIGDAVMTTPAVRGIRNTFPNARISMLAKPWVLPVFEDCPHVDDLVVYDAGGRHRGMAGKFRLARDLKPAGFDAAVLLQNAFEAALITRLAGIPCRIGFDTDARGWLLTHPVQCTPGIKKIHQTGYYLEILKGIGRPWGDRSLGLTIGHRRRTEGKRLLDRCGVKPGDTIVGINPSATFGPAKQWFPERFARLADRIHDACGAKILVFGGPDDRDLGRRITRLMRRPTIDLSGRTTLSEAMALIAACRLFISNDSGLMHVAAALDTPLIAIFGSTNPVTTGPQSERSRVIRSDISCSPCLKPVCPEGHLDCMDRIGVDRVFDAVRAML